MRQRRPLGPLSLSSPIGKLIQCHRHCKEHGGERFDLISHHHAHQAEVHMQMYIEGMCATEVEE
jgi:hypothetical protein